MAPTTPAKATPSLRDRALEHHKRTATVAFNELFAATVKAGVTLARMSLCLDEPGVPLDLGRLDATDCLYLARRINSLLALESDVNRASAEDGGAPVVCPHCNRIVLWNNSLSRCPNCGGGLNPPV